jgi:hypothetical protein
MKKLTQKIAIWIYALAPVVWINAQIRQFITVTWATHPWIRAWNIKKLMIDLEWNSATICSDPINGCVGDFAEDFGRQRELLYWELERISVDIPEILLETYDYFLQARYEILEAQYNNLPWNSDEWSEFDEARYYIEALPWENGKPRNEELYNELIQDLMYAESPEKLPF